MKLTFNITRILISFTRKAFILHFTLLYLIYCLTKASGETITTIVEDFTHLSCIFFGIVSGFAKNFTRAVYQSFFEKTISLAISNLRQKQSNPEEKVLQEELKNLIQVFS